MPEKSSQYFRRKTITIDNYLSRAIETWYELLYVYLRHHPDMAADIERLMLETNLIREHWRGFFIRAWHHDLECFDSIPGIAILISEARRDCDQEDTICSIYSGEPDRLQRELSALRIRLDAQLLRLSALSSPSSLQSPNPTYLADLDTSDSATN